MTYRRENVPMEIPRVRVGEGSMLFSIRKRLPAYIVIT